MSSSLIENTDLSWYFRDSAAELGLRGQCYGEIVSGETKPRFPSDRQCAAAARQRKITIALRGLSNRMQAALEAAYDPRPFAIQLVSEHGMAAGIIARLPRKLRSGNSIEAVFAMTQAHQLLATAHAAFKISYHPPRAQNRVTARKARVQAWYADAAI